MRPYNLLLIDETGAVCHIEPLNACDQVAAIQAAEAVVASANLAGYEIWQGGTKVTGGRPQGAMGRYAFALIPRA